MFCKGAEQTGEAPSGIKVVVKVVSKTGETVGVVSVFVVFKGKNNGKLQGSFKAFTTLFVLTAEVTATGYKSVIKASFVAFTKLPCVGTTKKACFPLFFGRRQ